MSTGTRPPYLGASVQWPGQTRRCNTVSEPPPPPSPPPPPLPPHACLLPEDGGGAGYCLSRHERNHLAHAENGNTSSASQAGRGVSCVFLVLTSSSARSRSEAVTFGGIPMASSVASQMLTISGVQVSVGEALKQPGHVLGGDIVNVAPDGRCTASTIVAASNVLTYMTTPRTEGGYAQLLHDVQREERQAREWLEGIGAVAERHGKAHYVERLMALAGGACAEADDFQIYAKAIRHCIVVCPCQHFREAQVADRSVGEASVSQRKGPLPTCPVLAPTEPDDESAFTAVAAWVQERHASEPKFRVSGEGHAAVAGTVVGVSGVGETDTQRERKRTHHF